MASFIILLKSSVVSAARAVFNLLSKSELPFFYGDTDVYFFIGNLEVIRCVAGEVEYLHIGIGDDGG